MDLYLQLTRSEWQCAIAISTAKGKKLEEVGKETGASQITTNESVCLHLSVYLRSKERDGVKESASQSRREEGRGRGIDIVRGRERERELVTWNSTPLHQAAYGRPAVRSHSMAMGL